MKKYLSSLLCISLLIMATGCGKEEVEIDTPSETEITNDVYLTKYDEYLNHDHNIVFVKNLLEKAHNEIDDEEINQLYADFQSGSLNNGEYTYVLRNTEGSVYDYYRGFRFKHWYYRENVRETIIKYPSVRTIENVFGEGYPTLFKHNEEGTITDLYIIDPANMDEPNTMYHLCLDEEGNYIFDNDMGKVVLNNELVSNIEYYGVQYNYSYDDLGRLVKVVISNGSTVEYIYDAEESQAYPSKAIKDGVNYVYDEKGHLIAIENDEYGVSETEVERTHNFEYNDQDQIVNYKLTSHYLEEDKIEVEEYQYTYNDEGLLVEQVVVDDESNPINHKTIEYSEDGLTVSTTITDGSGNVDFAKYTEVFDENYQLVSQDIIECHENYDINKY